jgi:peptide/nickel transport system substrate-binding protein
MSNYWTAVLSQRLARRRALAATGGAAAAAALLAACGGGDSGGGGDGDSSGLVARPADTTKDAKRGGTLKDYIRGDPITLDPYNPNAALNFVAKSVYGTLLRERPGTLEPAQGIIDGDLAESWEFSQDGLQMTMKLRQNAKWHNRPPINGRTIDVDDVVFSWKRYEEKAPLASLLANSKSPDSPVLSVTAPDSRTIAVKLKEPVVYVSNYFASMGSFTGQVIMYPKETDSTFDNRVEANGHGPFMVTSYQPSVGFTMRRHADYWDKDYALIDQIDMPIVIEYAAQLAQFKAGNMYYFGAIRAEDVLPTKRDEPRLDLYATDTAATSQVVTFGQLPERTSPFLDERVRQAVSMSLDRDLMNAVKYYVNEYKAEGLPVETRWNSHLPASWDGWWIDPRDKDFGPNGKFFEYNVAEAKKLLAAAGHPNGFEMTLRFPASPQLSYERDTIAMIGNLQEIGLKVSQEAIADYTKRYIPDIRDGNGQYEGIAVHSVTGGIPFSVNETAALVAVHWPQSGVTFHGYSTNGRNDKSGDPALNTMLAKARTERDMEARKKLVGDIQRYLGKAQHSMILPQGGANGFNLAWPALKNYRVFDGESIWNMYRLWIDQTKPPFTA